MTAISPIHTNFDFPSDRKTWTLEQKFEIFEARVLGWQLGIADKMLNDNIPQMRHSGYAALSVVLSFIEMIAKYREGYIPEDPKREISGDYFNNGLELIYPNVFTDGQKKEIYGNLRCGLYHIGQTKGRIWISGGYKRGLFYDESSDSSFSNPHILVKDLIGYFQKYKQKILYDKEKDFRKNFEMRFDLDNEIK